jgi:hypothetical protein
MRNLVTPEGTESRTVKRAFSIMSDSPVPYEVTEYYFEVKVLADPSNIE